MTLKITAKLRKELKKPFGKVLGKIRKHKKIITVGDYCSKKAFEENVIPDLIIYDGKIKRKSAPNTKKALDKIERKTIEIENKAGTISDEAWIAIEIGLREKTKIRVKGEEDLLVIPCIDLAKEKTAIYYGQPDKGIVEVIVTKQTKQKIKEIIEEMEVIK